MLDEQTYNIESLTPSDIVYTSICATYPFLNPAEEADFHGRVAQITTNDEPERIRLLLESLDNPHVSIKKLSADRTGHELSPDRQPYAEIVDEVMVVTIPSWDKNIDINSIMAKVQDSLGNYKGVVIDLRDNTGGSDNPAYKFAELFISKVLIRSELFTYETKKKV